MKKLFTILNEKAEEWLLVASLIAVVILVILQVFFRYVIHASLGWSEEIARYALIWITWISTSYAVRKHSHIRVEFIKDMFSDKVKKYIEFIVLSLWFLLALFLAVEGTKLVMTIYGTGQVSPSTQLPIWFIYMAVPIGGTLMCIRLIQEAYKVLKHGAEKGDID